MILIGHIETDYWRVAAALLFSIVAVR